jgi:predicted RNase H-like nuclease (RuvC/YqgF family)
MKKTISLKLARSLHAEIRSQRASIEDLESSNGTLGVDLRAAQRLILELTTANDDLARQINAKGEEVGRVNARVERLRQIVETLCNGYAIAAAATNNAAQISTFLALQRDGRAQLEKALNGNGNGGHA